MCRLAISTARDCSCCREDVALTVCKYFRRLSGFTRRMYRNFCAYSDRMSRQPCPMRLNSSLNLVISLPHFRFSSLAKLWVFIPPNSLRRSSTISAYCMSIHCAWWANQVNARPLSSYINLVFFWHARIPVIIMKYSSFAKNVSRGPVPSNFGHAFPSILSTGVTGGTEAYCGSAGNPGGGAS